MMAKVPNRDARGETMPRPEAPSDAPLSNDGGGSSTVLDPSPIPEPVEVDDDLYSGRQTKFIPAVSFDGYPDGKTKVTYVADVEAEAPSKYVKHLKSKGLAAN